MRPLLPKALRLLFPGLKSSFVFEQQPVALPPKPAGLNLYIHLPFCRSICHFCPYVKNLYNADTSVAYQKAILQELDGYRRIWGDINIESIYFGGGTPSLTPGILEKTLSWIDHNFHLSHEIGVEIHPLDADSITINSLKNSGVTMVSMGVQSFNDRLLGILGRGYDGKAAMKSCEMLLKAGFDTVDVDLIFAIPSQEVQEAENDVEIAGKLRSEQFSSYPLIPFSYTPLKPSLNKAGLILPTWRVEKRMLNAIVKKARTAGYRRTSIWSFNRPQTNRYTTVTRDAFIGIGTGASSRMGDYFWLNTFSTADYIKAMSDIQSPLALATRLNDGDKIAYWLFWQGYNTAINTDTFQSIFSQDLPYRIKVLLSLLNFLRFSYREGPNIRLTDAGAYLFHLIEKGYTHAYLETLWQACFQEAWPRRLVI